MTNFIMDQAVRTPALMQVLVSVHLLFIYRIVQDLLVAPQAAARPPQPRYPPATISEVGAGEDRVDRESGAGEMEVSEGEASSNPASLHPHTTTLTSFSSPIILLNLSASEINLAGLRVIN